MGKETMSNTINNYPPPAPKKDHTQYFNRDNNTWIYIKKEDPVIDYPPPAPLKGYTQYFDNNNHTWVYVKSNSIH